MTKSNYQEFQRFQSVDVPIAGDVEATLPALIEAVKLALPDEPQGRDRKARPGHQGGSRQGPRKHQAGGRHRLGRKPDQHRAAVHGDLCADQGHGLVAGAVVRQCQRLAAAAVGDGQALPLDRDVRRLRRRLGRAGFGRRCAGQPRRRALLGLDPVRRRHDVRAGRAVDRGAPQDPDACGHAQQPRLSPGGDARAAAGELPQSHGQCRQRSWRRSAPAS